MRRKYREKLRCSVTLLTATDHVFAIDKIPQAQGGSNSFTLRGATLQCAEYHAGKKQRELAKEERGRKRERENESVTSPRGKVEGVLLYRRPVPS